MITITTKHFIQWLCIKFIPIGKSNFPKTFITLIHTNVNEKTPNIIRVSVASPIPNASHTAFPWDEPRISNQVNGLLMDFYYTEGMSAWLYIHIHTALWCVRIVVPERVHFNVPAIYLIYTLSPTPNTTRLLFEYSKICLLNFCTPNESPKTTIFSTPNNPISSTAHKYNIDDTHAAHSANSRIENPLITLGNITFSSVYICGWLFVYLVVYV